MSLREEVVQSQKARSDLFKWKLSLIAVLGTVGLGLAKDMKQVDLALCFIPLVGMCLRAVLSHKHTNISNRRFFAITS